MLWLLLTCCLEARRVNPASELQREEGEHRLTNPLWYHSPLYDTLIDLLFRCDIDTDFTSIVLTISLLHSIKTPYPYYLFVGCFIIVIYATAIYLPRRDIRMSAKKGSGIFVA